MANNETITMSISTFEEIVNIAFNNGQSWGITYSPWFIPTEKEHLEKVTECIEKCKKLVEHK